MRFKMPKHKLGATPYFILGATWIIQYVGMNSSWWSKQIQPHLEYILWPWSIPFAIGWLVADLFNPNSWLRESWRLFIKKVEVLSVHVSQPVDEPRRIEVNVDVQFLKRIRKATLTLQIYSCTGISYPPHFHAIHVETLVDILKGQKERIKIATLAVPHPGWEPFPSFWGTLETNAPSLIGQSKNVAILELTGPMLITQRHKIYVRNMDYGSTQNMPTIYAQHEDEDVFVT